MLALVLFVGLAQTDLVFVRHAETVANATGKYNSRTLDEFSAKGDTQIAALTKELLGEPRFDRIYVSPSPRALKTITPYLRATGQKAIVWPLLYECCTGSHRVGGPTKFAWGSRVKIPGDLSNYFVVKPRMDRLPNSPDFGSGLAQVRETVRVFKKDLSGGRVLLVGHSGHGGQFLHELTGKWRKVENATPIRLPL